VQLDKQVYEYTGEDFDPRAEQLLDQYYGGQDLVDSDNLTAALMQAYDNSSSIAQVTKNTTVKVNETVKLNATTN
jgi:LPS O-antigen subunit length determinant protein (WzzB/FepE family)